MKNARLHVRVHARASRDELGGLRDGVVQVRVVAPAIEDRANTAVRRLLARRLRVAPSRVTVVHGRHSRDKLIEVEGVDQETLESALER